MSERGGPPRNKKDDTFNTPFKDALKVLQQQQKKPATPPKPAAPPPPSRPARRRPSPEEDEAALFLSAMDGVAPITDRGEPPAPNPRLPEIIDENAEALAELSELVAGTGAFDIADSDEFIEGSAPGLDKRLMRALRRGDFTVQGRLDLHGMTQVQAKEAVERFVAHSRRAGNRCVLIIHGRGLHSKDQLPVLKERLRVWLSQKSIGRAVLAFATARPHDGGTGAIYVLLRR